MGRNEVQCCECGVGFSPEEVGQEYCRQHDDGQWACPRCLTEYLEATNLAEGVVPAIIRTLEGCQGFRPERWN